MKKHLAGKVVVITGAGRGLGKALAEAFSAEGASLVLGARTSIEIDELAARLPNTIAVQTDVRLPRDVDRLVEAAMAEFGRVDVMINNAGLAIYGPVDDTTPDAVDAMIDTNVKGVIYGSQAAFRAMKAQRSGLIVNISSIAGKLHLPNEAVYNASKWAVNGFTGTLRLEAAKFNVKVSCVCPGGIDTPFWKAMDFYPFPEGIDPGRDFMSPEEVAQTVLEMALKSDRYVVPEVVMVPLL
ncbi:MAG: SDR family oxidoreductase [Deltaproteobacteria bacterium]|nr:SDR family oxidoreductase [Deltaproteobacteria bacterium]